MATLNQYIVNILPQIQRYLSEQPVRCAWEKKHRIAMSIF